jgi:hypothetical protein
MELTLHYLIGAMLIECSDRFNRELEMRSLISPTNVSVRHEGSGVQDYRINLGMVAGGERRETGVDHVCHVVDGDESH